MRPSLRHRPIPFRKFKIPLQVILVVPLITQIVAFVALTGYLTYRSGQATIYDLGNQLIDELTKRVDERLDNYLEDALLVTRINADAFQISQLSFTDLPTIQRRFLLQMRQIQSLDGVYLGTRTGEYLGVHRDLQNQLRSSASKAFYPQIANLTQPGNAVSVTLRQDYDPRTRPWYQAATRPDQPTWSPIYEFTQGDLGITAVQPINQQNTQQGVVAVDLRLSVLSKFLRSLQLTPSGQALILERSGDLVATSTGESPYTLNPNNEMQRLPGINSKDPLTRGTLQYITNTLNLSQPNLVKQFQFELVGKLYFLKVLPYSDQANLDWLIVVVVPETDFMEQIAANRRTTLWLCGLAIAPAVFISYLTSRWIARPIFQLARASEALADGDLNQEVRETGVQELEILADSFNCMGYQIKNAFGELEVRVEERTAQLQQEIADRQQIEQALRLSENKFAKAFHCNPNPSAIVRVQEGKIIELNQSAVQFFGYDRADEMMDQTTHNLNIWVNQKERDRIGNLLQQKGEVQDLEVQFYNRSGEIKTVLYSAELLELNRQPCQLIILSDITHRKQAEIVLERAKEAAESANRSKSEFLANMSHELRTPLNAILGFSQLMVRDPALKAEQQKNLSIINSSGEHLLALINDILDLSKIEAGRMVLEETDFDLFDLLKTLEQLFRLKADTKGLTIQFERDENLPQFIRADKGKLRQVLINLLSNAIKFTEKGGIALHTSAEIITADQLQVNFEVSDTGPGIKPEDLDTIFEVFMQSETGRQSQQGTGLGLPISRRFVQMMGGDIVVHSTPGEGTAFTFSIQATPGNISQIQAQLFHQAVMGLVPGQPDYRILVVDDRWENRQLLTRLLKMVGFQVQEAGNGQVAVDVWQQWQPHLIWMDMRMPVMDGYEATRMIRASPQGKSTVIIALTASAFEQDRGAVLAAGCNDFVRKPFRESIIFEKMAQYLGIRYRYAEEPEENHGLTSASTRPSQDITTSDLKVMPSNG
ncbi:MAG: response regulator [Oscillatoriales cyanobacterium SM2_3_0]|nr:response regulator [Oscillatoriales cyanobacterium SM2_3_0]